MVKEGPGEGGLVGEVVGPAPLREHFQFQVRGDWEEGGGIPRGGSGFRAHQVRGKKKHPKIRGGVATPLLGFISGGGGQKRGFQNFKI